jgi:6-phosphogluconate dehydrogenase
LHHVPRQSRQVSIYPFFERFSRGYVSICFFFHPSLFFFFFQFVPPFLCNLNCNNHYNTKFLFSQLPPISPLTIKNLYISIFLACLFHVIHPLSAVDELIEKFKTVVEEGDILIDGGNEWFENTERRSKDLETVGIRYLAVGVSGGEEGARKGPSIMPGGPRDAWDCIAPIFTKIAAQVGDQSCTAYLGKGGAGNYVKMVHNGIEYGDMQLIAEAYDILKHIAGMSNEELAKTFAEWNCGKLQSYLIEITATIFAKKDTDVYDSQGNKLESKGEYVVDQVLDCTANKGTGKMTVKQGADQGVACPTIASALDQRFVSFLKDDRVAASEILTGPTEVPQVDREQLLKDVRDALYAAKICSYAQGMMLIQAASKTYEWDIDLGTCARIWKGGCIIRAAFLDRITQAFERNPNLPSLLVDSEFANEVNSRQSSWRRVVSLCVATGIACPSMGASLSYFDGYRRARLPANLTQAQRDFFGSHTFERCDKPRGEAFHCKWTDAHA